MPAMAAHVASRPRPAHRIVVFVRASRFQRRATRRRRQRQRTERQAGQLLACLASYCSSCPLSSPLQNALSVVDKSFARRYPAFELLRAGLRPRTTGRRGACAAPAHDEQGAMPASPVLESRPEPSATFRDAYARARSRSLSQQQQTTPADTKAPPPAAGCTSPGLSESPSSPPNSQLSTPTGTSPTASAVFSSSTTAATSTSTSAPVSTQPEGPASKPSPTSTPSGKGASTQKKASQAVARGSVLIAAGPIPEDDEHHHQQPSETRRLSFDLAATSPPPASPPLVATTASASNGGAAFALMSPLSPTLSHSTRWLSPGSPSGTSASGSQAGFEPLKRVVSAGAGPPPSHHHAVSGSSLLGVLSRRFTLSGLRRNVRLSLSLARPRVSALQMI